MSASNFWEVVKIEIDLLQLLLDLHDIFPEQDYLSVYEYISHGEYGVALEAIWFDIQEGGVPEAIKNKVIRLAMDIGVDL